MPYLIREQENTVDKLNWFTTLGGVLTDMASVGFRIFDISSSFPGPQIFPVTEGEYEDVTTSGKFGTGSYYAFDNTTGAGWAPLITASLGTYRIEWRWKLLDGDSFQAHSEDFEVYSASGSAPPGGDTYISVADVRALGLSVDDYSDEVVLASIYTWQAFLERACRQWFLPKTMVFSVDGNDSDTLMFGVPVISLEYLKLNGSTDELSSDYYSVYTGYDYPDDRHNPRVSLNTSGSYSIFSGNLGCGKFVKGRQNQELKGVFGFVESDGSTPYLIQRALSKLVVEKLTIPIYGSAEDIEAAPPIVGALLEKWVDGHKMKYSDAGGPISKRAPGLIGITQDQEILDIIRLYKAPIGIASPAHPSVV